MIECPLCRRPAGCLMRLQLDAEVSVCPECHGWLSMIQQGMYPVYFQSMRKPHVNALSATATVQETPPTQAAGAERSAGHQHQQEPPGAPPCDDGKSDGAAGEPDDHRRGAGQHEKAKSVIVAYGHLA